MGKFIGIHTHNKDKVLSILSNKFSKIEIIDIINKNYDHFEKYGILPYFDNFEHNNDYYQIRVYYTNDTERNKIFNTFNLPVSTRPYIHYEYKTKGNIEYKILENVECKYPIYIVSKNRYHIDRCLTIKYLEKSKIPYTLCIIENERSQYQSLLTDNNFNYCKKIISINNNYDMGSTPQRNKCWEHAREHGYHRHWVLDDNIYDYIYFNYLQRNTIYNASAFRVLEDFVDNIKEPVAIIGHNYKNDVKVTELRDPFSINNKVYSSMLISNHLLDQHSISWRLKYNEDVCLCIDSIKNGLYTIGMNQLLSNKNATGKTKGGNEDIYKQFSTSGFQSKFECLEKEYPEYVSLDSKYKDGRPHHRVNWKLVNANLNSTLTVIENKTWSSLISPSN